MKKCLASVSTLGLLFLLTVGCGSVESPALEYADVLSLEIFEPQDEATVNVSDRKSVV